MKVGKQGTTLATVSSGSASSAIPLVVGSNALKVEVTAEDGTTTQTYTVTVTRQQAQAQAQATDATLSALTGNTSTDGSSFSGTLNIGTFASGTTTYTTTVANTVTHVKLTPTVNDSDATVKVGKQGSLTTVSSGSASSAIPLVVGSNALKVEVTAEDGTTTQTYTVTVTRQQAQAQAQATDATLSALTGNTSTDGSSFSGTLSIGTFASGTTTYTATVANTVTHVKLTPTVNDSDATVKVGKQGSLTTASSGSASSAIPLVVGSNALKVEVTAEDGTTTQTYTVTVTRQQAQAQATDATLSALTGNTSTDGSSFSGTLSIGTDPDLHGDGDPAAGAGAGAGHGRHVERSDGQHQHGRLQLQRNAEHRHLCFRHHLLHGDGGEHGDPREAHTHGERFGRHREGGQARQSDDGKQWQRQ